MAPSYTFITLATRGSTTLGGTTRRASAAFAEDRPARARRARSLARLLFAAPRDFFLRCFFAMWAKTRKTYSKLRVVKSMQADGMCFFDGRVWSFKLTLFGAPVCDLRYSG